MRPIHKVIEAIKTIIPEIPADQEGRADLIYELDEILASDAYASPEHTGLMWDRLCTALADHLGNADLPWKIQIKDVMSGKTDYRTVLGE